MGPGPLNVSYERDIPIGVLQKNFNQEIFLVALALCFKEHEKSLPLDQLNARKFTPDAGYSRVWINELLLAGSINCHVGASRSNGNSICVERPSGASNRIHRFVANNVKRLKTYLSDAEECTEYVSALRNDLLSCECIEYANFFAIRENLKMIAASPYDPNLQLLLLENEREQVFMLLWRSIKNHAESSRMNIKEISFSQVTQTALEYYFYYKSKNAIIDFYKWPKELGASKLAFVLNLIGVD